MASTRVLLTGASGLFGANFLWQYAKRFDIIAVAHQHPVSGAAETITLDVTQDAAVQEAVRRVRPHVIVHAAAMTGVDACEEAPEAAMALNAGATGSLARAAHVVGAYVIALSTDYVFNGAKGMYTEDDPPKPLGVYARTKWLGEQAALSRCPNATVLRTTLYGWNAQPKESFAERVIHGAESGKPATAFTDMYWSPILANDLADAVAALIEHPTPGLFHAAGRERCSRYEFACVVAEAFGYDPKTTVRSGRLADTTFKAPRPSDASLDVSRFERALGVTLSGYRKGIARMRTLADEGLVPQLQRLIGPVPQNSCGTSRA